MRHILQNKHWQAGILPQSGASIAFGRIRLSGTWVDALRPTAEADYDNSSKASSFIMLPWANRIRDGILRFDGQSYQLQTSSDDGTARHGDVRKRPWQIAAHDETHITLTFDSRHHESINYPFAFTAQITYRLDEADFVWELALTNVDERVMPAGFGFHPYFVRPSTTMPALQVPCDQHFRLTDAPATGAPVPLPDALDFRQPRPVPPDMRLDDLLTGRRPQMPVQLRYEDWHVAIEMHADSIFAHVLVFTAPDGTLAVEPQSNANDGFNLYANGIDGSGVFTLEPQETITGIVTLRSVAIAG